MNVRLPLTMLLFATMAVSAPHAAADGAPGNSTAAGDAGQRDYAPVRIQRKQLQPATVTITQGDAVLWANYSEHLAQVTFPVEAARRMVCREPSNFVIEGDTLRSEPMGRNVFASVCVFTKGRYDYDVVMLDIGPTSSDLRRLRSTLVVE